MLRRFFDWFNRAFDRATNGYVRISAALVRKSVFAVLLLAGFGVAGLWIGGKVPTSFVPDEDPGYFYVNVQLPNAASLRRTEDVVAKIQKIVSATPGVAHFTSVTGFSLLSLVRTSYNAFGFISLKEWGSRKDRAQQFQAIKAHLNAELSKLPEGVAFGFSPPAIPGVGTSGGFTFILEDRSGGNVQFLSDNLNKFMAAARKRPEIGNLTTTFLPSVPQQFVAVDRDKVIKQGVPINDVYRTIQAFMGGLFVNYFNRFGRQWQVYVEAEGDYRTKPENVGQFYVRNAAGEMVPLSALTKFEARNGPEFTMRFNEYRSAQLNGGAAPGYSSNQAMKALEETFAQTMPAEMGYDYSGISFQEKKAQEGVSSGVIFGVLAAIRIPDSGGPLRKLDACPSAFCSVRRSRSSAPSRSCGCAAPCWGTCCRRTWCKSRRDVYSQIGLVMLIGLSAKNAILIVEFAKDEFEKGRPLADAALEGARLRLRPILMTSFAFILGCVPLWIATGAGAVARQIMGTTVIGGHGGGQRDRHFPDSRGLLPGGKAFRRDRAPGLPDSSATAPARGRRLTMRGRTFVILIAGLTVGCTVGPNYTRPATSVPTAFRAPAPLPPRKRHPSPISNGSTSSKTRSCRI